MKTIGLLGGLSWQSTISYYRAINEGVNAVLGGQHSAKICLYSVDFDEMERLQHQDEWPKCAEIMSNAARAVQAGGADFLLLCTNTMHKVVPEIEAAIDIPILHIVDATASALEADGRTSVGLLGTRFTMEQDFYRERMSQQHGIDIIVPDAEQRQFVHDVIYEELCFADFQESSRRDYLKIIADLYLQGAQAVILGCTEIALLVQQVHTDVPLYDTANIHAAAAVQLATS